MDFNTFADKATLMLDVTQANDTTPSVKWP